ncbi:helix-turn-helix domain-containing protein [Streptomyces sp. MJP52]|uniref:helix-turn-helix domain-containing protein n=1 Tax=Streptomyces sp. MJP52 TaxID=2940555 RepID=UPI00247533E6|nr:helix-turn-helix domain-containing protein [Streptomyces sp. MJP52]MDH6223647.1 putative transcriptional regulator [Streptomyces sp. MJP52]
MSVTTLTTAAPETPVSDPLAALPPSCRTVRTHLLTLTDPTSAPDIATAIGLGRSTAAKALAALEQHGLAERVTGHYVRTVRTPDLWKATALATPEPAAAAPEATEQPQTVPTPDTPEPVTPTEQQPTPPAPEALATAPAAAAPEAATPEPVPTPPAPEPAAPTAQAPTPVPAAPKLPAQRTAPALTVIPGGDGQRLAPGALRQLVLDHLTAHPGEAFTSTRISRAIGRSSGAIANALVTLTRHGLAEQVTSRPMTYRLA